MDDTIEVFNMPLSIKQRDKEYLDSKEWFCETSPTKSHIWILQQPSRKKGLLINIEVCKHCHKEKMIVIKDTY